MFERVAGGVIAGNTAVLVWGWLDPAHQVVIDRIDTGLVVFFAAELAVRLRRGGWRWLGEPLNVFDGVVIVAALLPVVGDGINVLRVARAAKILHLGRHAGHLRVAAFVGRHAHNRDSRSTKGLVTRQVRE